MRWWVAGSISIPAEPLGMHLAKSSTASIADGAPENGQNSILKSNRRLPTKASRSTRPHGLSSNNAPMTIGQIFRRAAVLVLGATCLWGCLPVPWFYHTRPDIDGTVTLNGVPVEGATVGYSNEDRDEQCNSPSDSYTETKSSADGTFHFTGAHSFFHIVFLLPGIAEFGGGRICFDTSDGKRYSQRVFLRGGTIFGSIPNNQSWDLVTVDCNLALGVCQGTAD